MYQRFFFGRAFLAGLGTFLVVMVLTQFLIFQYRALRRAGDQKQAASELDFVRDGLEGVLANSLSATRSLSLIVQRYGVPKDFEGVAREILASHPNIDAVELTEGTMVTHFYPVEAGKDIVGDELLQDSSRRNDVVNTIQGKQLLLAGPLDFAPFGKVVIGRLPIFKNGSFWGFSVVIIRLSNLIRAAGINSPERSHFYYELSRVHPVSGAEEFFLSSPVNRADESSIAVKVPGGAWRLYVGSRQEDSGWLIFILLSLFGTAFSLMSGLMVLQLLRQPEKLRKQVEEKSREIEANEKYFKSLIEMSVDAVLLIDQQRNVIYQSPAADRISGYSIQERRLLDLEELVHPDDQQMLNSTFDSLFDVQGSTASWICRYKHKEGHYIWIEGTYTNLLGFEKVNAVVCHFHDVTARIEAEERTKLVNRLYVFKSSVNHTMIHTRDEYALLSDACEIAVDIGKFKMAWVGSIAEAGIVRPIIQAGEESNYLDRMATIVLDDPLLSNGPTGRAINERRIIFCNDIEHDPIMKPWAVDALGRGYRSSCALPIFKAGKVAYALMLYAPIINYFDEPELRLLEDVASDISFAIDNLENERELARKNEEIRKLSLVASSTDNPVVITDTQQRIEWVNESMVLRTGYTREELMGKIPSQFLTGPDTDKDALDRIRKSLAKGGPASEVLKYYTKDGTPYFALTRVNAIVNEKGELVQFVGIHTDLTRQKEYEKSILGMAAELSSLIENANAVILGVDMNGLINEWNRELERVIGYTKQEVIGLNLKDLMKSQHNKLVASQLIEEGVHGGIFNNKEVSVHDRNGKQVILLLGTTPRRNANGEILGVMAVGQDISELTTYRNSLEEIVRERTKELNASMQKEKELIEFKTRFVSMVSHEFRTPIATISIAAEFVRSYRHRVGDEVVDTKLGLILQEIEHLTNLMEDTLMMGKSNDFLIKVRKKKLNLQVFFNSLKEQMETAHDHSHTIEVDFALEHTDYRTDDGVLRNIFLNLVSNAIKYSPDQPIIRVSVREEAERYVIKVTDQGMGIPQEKLEHLFEPFVRGTNTQHITGTGLGMSIVKKAVDVLGGRIECDSILNMGTTFTVKLPINREPVNAAT